MPAATLIDNRTATSIQHHDLNLFVIAEQRLQTGVFDPFFIFILLKLELVRLF